MGKTAWVFPGQGSQSVGMGADVNEIPQAQARFDEAAHILGWSVLDVCSGDEAKLNYTLYTQPCLYVISSIFVDLLKEQGHHPDIVAGHSLGEYVALYAAGVFDFATGLKLVKTRAEVMTNASGGKMVAIMRFDRDKLEELVNQIEPVVLANDNSEQQVVISGLGEAVDQVIAELQPKKAVELKVSGAFHSPLMAEAASQFQQTLAPLQFQQPSCWVMSNVAPEPSKDEAELKHRLSQQMTGGVRWREIMLQFNELEVSDVWEVGPGKVLSGLIKRTCGDISLKSINSQASLLT